MTKSLDMSHDLPLSIILICLNEEKKLRLCLDSLPKGAEIIVVDSFSTDKTVEIARAFGAIVYQNKFVDFATQKNFAVKKATRPWVLSLDADERLTPATRSWLVSIVTAPLPAQGTVFSVKRRLHFLGKRLYFGRSSDDPLRLFSREHFEFRGSVHEALSAKDNLPFIKKDSGANNYLEHFSYDSLEEYFDKLNRYTSMMADKKISSSKSFRVFSAAHLSVRAVLIIINRFFIHLGFLDGYHGFLWAYLASVYHVVKLAKTNERILHLQRHQTR